MKAMTLNIKLVSDKGDWYQKYALYLFDYNTLLPTVYFFVP